MSYGGFGPSMPGRSSTTGGWSTGFTGPQLSQDETLFTSLFPIGGMVTGDQVKPIFEKSGLSPAKLFQIWNLVDSDRDGKINSTQFCQAMALIRQAQKEVSPALGGGGMTTPSLSHSWSTPLSGVGFKPTSPSSLAGFGSTPVAGVGFGVSLSTVSQGWAMKVQDKRKYVMQFNTMDKNKTGFLAGEEVRPFLTKSGLNTTILAKIWELADYDNDGRLSADEFAIALHLLEKARAGLTLPSTLPSELYPGQTKFHTIDRATTKKPPVERKVSVPDRKTTVTTTAADENSISFEDKRKENFEAGRLELERRRRAKREQQEREAAEKERKRREEEERRLQQEREAELAREAELERQRRKALEIEHERERQMQKLALKREAEQREIERKRKEEWARKRQQELEGHRDRERKSLISLQVQCEELDKELQYLNQRKVGISASAQRQKNLCVEFSASLRSLRLSHDVRRAELGKLQSELNGFQSQLSSLQHHRKELQRVLQTRNPELATHQYLRQQLKDTMIGLAASLAGLRSNMAYNTQTSERLTEEYKKHSGTLQEMKGVYQSEEVKTRELRVMVLTRKRVFDEQLRRQREEEQRRAVEAERARKEAERIKLEMEQRARREARLDKIKREQEMALKKAALDSVVADLNVSRPVPSTTTQTTTTIQSSSGFRPALPPKPAVLRHSKEIANRVEQKPTAPEKSDKEKDQEVLKKVQELQQRKAALQNQQKDSPVTVKKKSQPDKPAPFTATKKQKAAKSKEKPSVSKEDTLLDLMSSWDQGGPTSPSVINFQKNTSQILQPMKQDTEPEPHPQETPAPPTTATPTETSNKSSVVRIRDKPQPIKMHSVARLSQLFDKGLPSQDYANVQATSEVQVVAKQTADVPATPPVTMETKEPAQQLRVIYDFTASDSAEVSIKEGEMVTFVPGYDTSPGWMMVCVASGEKGWVPELYLERPGQEVGGDNEEEAIYDEPFEAANEPPPPVSPPPTEQSNSPPPLKAIVKFAWKGSKDNHLSLKRGAIVSVYEQSEKWWSGELDGKVGWFPRTFVKIIDEQQQQQQHRETIPATGERQSIAERPVRAETMSVSPGGGGSGESSTQLYGAVYDYEGEREGDLAFNTGDIIQVTAKDGEWWTGILNGIKGVFPSNYVQLKPDQQQQLPPKSVSPSDTPPGPNVEVSITTHSKPLIARVVAAFHSDKDGQLNLTQGELVKVRKQASNGWWEGELQRRGKQKTIGWFPSNRVELLSQRSHTTTSASSLPSTVGGAVGGAVGRAPHLGRARSPLLDVLEDRKSAAPTQNLVLALYTYAAQSSDELSFHKGSVINVLSQEGEWWKGEINGQTGLFPSNYVQNLTEPQSSSAEPTRWADSVSPDILEAVSDQERKRQEAIFELLTSERHYVDSLKLVKEVFFDPMAENDVLTPEELSKVFVNWDELISTSSELLSTFLVRLRTSGAVVRGIGDILATQIPKLTPHIRWCSCQLNACTLLQQKSSDPSFKEFEQRCAQDSRTGGLPLSSFLLKPMQRVTKYPLLVKRILEYTPMGHMDYEDISLALDEAETLCDQVNEGVRQKENTEHLEWLQSHVQFTLEERLVFNSQTNFMGSRRLLHWGKLFKIRGAKDVNVFLFNDFILILKPKLFFKKAATAADLELFGKNEFLMYRKPFLLDGVRVKKATSDQTNAHGGSVFMLITTSEEREILLKAESDRVRDQWIQKITKASLAYITTKKKQERVAQEKQMRTLKESVGMLSVTVVEACDLLAKDPNGRSDPFCVVNFGDHQEQHTPVIHSSLNPKWNFTMVFAVHDLNTEVLELTVFDKDLFSPNDFLGRAKLALKDLLRDGDSPWSKRMLLVDVNNGEIELKIDLKLNEKTLLL